MTLLSNFNTTACVGSRLFCSILSVKQYAISIQLLVSVRENKEPLVGYFLKNFNTTACVGSSSAVIAATSSTLISIQLLVSVRDRFICCNPRRYRISIQLLVSVRGEIVFDESEVVIEFQYNCLCRFERPLVIFFYGFLPISIQLLVSVREEKGEFLYHSN